MSTGPDHYREAERLLAGLADVELNSPREPVIIAEAQVHATLALAAATALARWDQLPEADADGWLCASADVAQEPQLASVGAIGGRS